MPSSKVRRRSPYLSRSASRNTKREARKASVAPIELANEASSVPSSSPNSAPAASVSTAAPGSDKPVTTTYNTKNAPAACHGLAAVHACSASCRAFSASRLSSPSSPLRHRAKATTTSTTARIRRVLERDMRVLRRRWMPSSATWKGQTGGERTRRLRKISYAHRCKRSTRFLYCSDQMSWSAVGPERRAEGAKSKDVCARSFDFASLRLGPTVFFDSKFELSFFQFN